MCLCAYKALIFQQVHSSTDIPEDTPVMSIVPTDITERDGAKEGFEGKKSVSSMYDKKCVGSECQFVPAIHPSPSPTLWVCVLVLILYHHI